MQKRVLSCVLLVVLLVGLSQIAAAESVVDNIVAWKAVDFINQEGGTVQIRSDRAYPTFSHWDYADHWVEWKVVVKEDGLYVPAAMYATGRDQAPRQLSLNGEVVLDMVFFSTGDFLTYQLGFFDPITLAAGEYTVRMTVSADPGVHVGVNPAWFAFLPVDVILGMDDDEIISTVEAMLGL